MNNNQLAIKAAEKIDADVDTTGNYVLEDQVSIIDSTYAPVFEVLRECRDWLLVHHCECQDMIDRGCGPQCRRCYLIASIDKHLQEDKG